MTTSTAGGTIPMGEFPALPSKIIPNIVSPRPPTLSIPDFSNILKPTPTLSTPTTPQKIVIMLREEPNIMWKSSKAKALIVKENLQYAIVKKFSYMESPI